MIKFIARVKCDNGPCTETAELGVRGTVNNDNCGWSGCGCVAGDLEVFEDKPWAERWSEYPEGRIYCPTCARDPLRFEREAKP